MFRIKQARRRDLRIENSAAGDSHLRYQLYTTT